ncbi:inositol-pentakisphosphate 2-kinase-like [Aristolochia californica]|uniref:inositol-pentakisphosphate 2-kinase-like n=1 Tax=Aristolochia californica TaxID=171875 RepID=UPI0035DECF00
MEVILQGKDAAEWVYRGEGAANLVLGYRGSSPAFVGKVIRVQKAPRSEPESNHDNSVLSTYERVVWGDANEMVDSKSNEALGRSFVLQVMRPLLGSQHVDAGRPVFVSTEFLESVEKNVLSQRPSWRVDAAKINTVCDSALLISDHSLFSHEDLCLAVEIKPKCGFLPSSRFIAERNAVKKSVSRFKMHQFLKHQKKEISRVSDYDPLDLFSGSKERISRAVRALYITPQNNFRIFLNGSLIFGGLGGGMDVVKSKSSDLFEDLTGGIIHAEYGQRLSRFLELVSETIFKSGLMDRLLKVQKLDQFDVEGAIHAYYNIISQPCIVCKCNNEVDLSDKCSFLHSISMQESAKIVREYLIAATAKDCSLMISFRPRSCGNLTSDFEFVHLEPSNQTFDYKAYFIDLDMKPLKKMVYYYELDQKIISYYEKMQIDTASLNVSIRCFRSLCGSDAEFIS